MVIWTREGHAAGCNRNNSVGFARSGFPPNAHLSAIVLVTGALRHRRRLEKVQALENQTLEDQTMDNQEVVP